MRCPKCGYISFDHLEQCLKCKKNIKAVSDTLHGTVFHVEVPNFLHVSKRRDEESGVDEAFTDTFESDEDFVDEDLEILVKDETVAETEVGTAADDFDAEDQGREGKTLAEESIDLEDREIEIDLSQFEDTEEPEVVVVEPRKTQNETETLSLDLPAELADLSDLAPPSKQEIQTAKQEPKKTAPKDGKSLEMGDVDFDLGLGGLDVDLADGSDPTQETVLALDDIDFAEPATKSSEKIPAKQSGPGMDDDLNFDLDLGGLSIHKDL
ncbi:MAG: hypothetical protein V2B20_03060 [Pseudomonadota bacterium]